MDQYAAAPWQNLSHLPNSSSPRQPFISQTCKATPSGLLKIVDATSVLAGKTSVVSISSGTWAEWQTQTFVSEAQNPELAKEVERLGKEGLQRVWVNIEEDWMKAGLIRLFLGGLGRG